MNTLTITRKDREAFEIFFSPESYNSIGKEGYYTIAATDDEDFIAGVLQFYVGEDIREGITAGITYIFVDEDFRGEGIGTHLINEFKGIVADSDIEWATAELYKDTGKELSKLLEEEGFVMEGEVSYYNVPLMRLEKSSAVKKADTSKCKSLEELSSEKCNAFFAGTGLRLDAKTLKAYDLKISSYFQEGESKGLFLVKKVEDTLETALIYTSEGSEKEIIALFAYSVAKAKELYGPQTMMLITSKEHLEYELLSKVAPELSADKYLLYRLEKALIVRINHERAL